MKSQAAPAPPATDVLTPVVPPTYPPAPKPSPLSPDAMEKVTVYKRFCQYIKSNYGMHIPLDPDKRAFNVVRYTDKYHAVSAIDSDIVPRVGADRLPEELLVVPKQFKRTRKLKVVKEKGNANIADLPEEDDTGGEGDKEGKEEGEPVAKKTKAETDPNSAPDFDEEEGEDADEELDMGTDYATSYFDNGEDFLDSDHEGDDDGPVY